MVGINRFPGQCPGTATLSWHSPLPLCSHPSSSSRSRGCPHSCSSPILHSQAWPRPSASPEENGKNPLGLQPGRAGWRGRGSGEVSRCTHTHGCTRTQPRTPACTRTHSPTPTALPPSLPLHQQHLLCSRSERAGRGQCPPSSQPALPVPAGLRAGAARRVRCGTGSHGVPSAPPPPRPRPVPSPAGQRVRCLSVGLGSPLSAGAPSSRGQGAAQPRHRAPGRAWRSQRPG